MLILWQVGQKHRMSNAECRMSSGSDIWYGFEFLAAVDMFFAKIAINSSFSCVEFVISA
jgi:hypothetical protein